MVHLILILKFIFAVVFTETITELLTKSEIFRCVRERLFTFRHKKFAKFLHDLLDCGYCTSVWVGCLMALLLFKDVSIITIYVDWIFIGLIIHRCSNIIHFGIDRLNSNHGLYLSDKE